MARSVLLTSGNYIGRFAPSPTGHLHRGSLVAAVGSYLRARRCGGRWLLRMEDLDPPRELPGAADAILATLEAHGLLWDGPVLYQSNRLEAYQSALQQLVDQGDAYPCHCSRRQVADQGRSGRFGMIYSGHCRDNPPATHTGGTQTAWRIRTNNQPVGFRDLRCGAYQQLLESEVGDFVIQRADGFFAYQLAVVVDDQFQGITEVVRGEDLLDNTPRQIFLQQRLGFQTPDYLHLPLVTNEKGQKLSKQTFARRLDPADAGNNLITALRHLGLDTPRGLAHAAVADILDWAVAHFKTTALPTCRVASH